MLFGPIFLGNSPVEPRAFVYLLCNVVFLCVFCAGWASSGRVAQVKAMFVVVSSPDARSHGHPLAGHGLIWPQLPRFSMLSMMFVLSLGCSAARRCVFPAPSVVTPLRVPR